MSERTTDSTAAGLIADYAETWRLLAKYDEGELEVPSTACPSRTVLTPDAANRAVAELKRELIARGEASPLFGRARNDALAGILGAVEQTMFGEPLYRSREEKAAHLLYFVVKDAGRARARHPACRAQPLTISVPRPGRKLWSGEHVRHKVVLPGWQGPATATTGDSRAARRRPVRAGSRTGSGIRRRPV